MGVTKGLDFFKLEKASYAAVAGAAALVLCVPARALSTMRLPMPDAHRVYVAGAGLLALAMLIARTVAAACARRDARRARLRILELLTAHERCVLMNFMMGDTTTYAFDAGDGVVHGLCRKGVLALATAVPRGDGRMTLDFILLMWAWEMLRADLSLLEGWQAHLVEHRRHRAA